MTGCCLVFLSPFWFPRPSSFINFRVARILFSDLSICFWCFMLLVCPYFHFGESFLILAGIWLSWIIVGIIWFICGKVNAFWHGHGKICKSYNQAFGLFFDKHFSFWNMQKLDIQVTNFKIANKLYLYHFHFLVYNIRFFNAW